MLTKHSRLSGKEIQYILRRGGKIYGKLFVFRIIAQYKNISYPQRSVQIPIKLDKRATMRNMLKREAKRTFVELTGQQKTTPAYKVFIFVNKQGVESWKDVIATWDKTRIVEARHRACREDFTSFFAKVWAVLSTSSQHWSRRPNILWKKWKRKKISDTKK